jgi:hypothetical protein
MQIIQQLYINNMKRILLLFLFIPFISQAQFKYNDHKAIANMDTLGIWNGVLPIIDRTNGHIMQMTVTHGEHITTQERVASQIHDSVQNISPSTVQSLHKINFGSSYKISFAHLNTQYLPYTVASNITITPDTVGSFSGASTIADFVGDGTHTIYFSGFSSVNGSDIDSFKFVNNIRYTYLFGKMGCCKYRYAIQDSMEVEGAPYQLITPSNFQATPASQTQINLSWTQQTTCRYYQLDSAHTSGGTWATLSSTIDKRATSYNVTGLTNNTTHYFRLRKLGNNTDSLHSAYATANATTSSLSTLSTPTINTPTVISSTEIDLALASNISNNSGYDWTISRNGGSSFTTLAHTTTNTTTYNFTTGHADSTYQFKARATGDLVTYNHSAYSAAVTGTTAGSAPTLSSAATNTTGDTVHMVFSKAMQSSPSSTGLSFSPSKTISSITRHSTNTSQYDVAVSVAFANSNTITCSYTPGNIVANDGGTLGLFSSQAVTNNTVESDTWENLGNFTFATAGTVQMLHRSAAGDFKIKASVGTRGLTGVTAFTLGMDKSPSTYLEHYIFYFNDTHARCLHNETLLAIGTNVYQNNQWIQIRRTGTTVYYEWSNDGVTWNLITTETGVTGTRYAQLWNVNANTGLDSVMVNQGFITY